jgi:hypothetical protein
VKRVFSFSLTSLLVAGFLIFQAGCGGGEPAAPPVGAPESSAPAPEAATPPAATTTPVDRSQMELLETRQSATQTTITLTGRVKNVSPREVMGVQVSANFQDANGGSVRVEQGSLARDPLPPNEISEFRITTPYSETIKRFNVSFAELFGGPLTMKDSRQP